MGEAWPALLARVALIERSWLRTGHSGRSIGFIPFPRARFLTYLVEAMEAAPAARSFLDVGCGPGTKVMLAEGFGLRGWGIDYLPEYIAACADNGAGATLADALAWDGYGGYDILFMNRPLRGTLQHELERRVMSQMHPRAVLILVNSRCDPPPGWLPVVEEVDELCSIWQKG